MTNSSPTSLPSGDYYDWTASRAPERPWRHDYSQTLVMKLFLCSRNSDGSVGRVYATFAEALEIIERLDALTLGIPKILYLTGWQFTGHDSGYPAWGEVNERLRRPGDDSAVDSLRWLIRAAREHHTTVSLHLNMTDAYPDSPLWSTYLAEDIVLKDEAGEPIPGEEFDGSTSYQLSYAQEWRAGRTGQRIDGLLTLIPELRESATIHLDAFHSIQPVRPDATLSSPYLGLTIDDEVRAQRMIFRYWQDHGLDVTAEGGKYWLRPDPFVGLQPMAWHFEPDTFVTEEWIGKPEGFSGLPADLYCGTPMGAEAEIMRDPVALPGLLEQFCTAVVLWFYDNSHAPKPDHHLWSRGPDVLMPALWRPDLLVAYSPEGYQGRRWELPRAWHGGTVTITPLRPGSPTEQTATTTAEVDESGLELTLGAGTAVTIELDWRE